MRTVTVLRWLLVGALGCSGIERGGVHAPGDAMVDGGESGWDAVLDPGGPDVVLDPGGWDTGADGSVSSEVTEGDWPVGRLVWWPAVFAGVSKGGGLTLLPFAPAGLGVGESVGGGLRVRPLVP